MMTAPQTFRDVLHIARGNRGMVSMIVARCHVSDSFQEVGDYVVSRMTGPVPMWAEKVVRMLSHLEHTRNRREYRSVMWHR